MKNIKEYIESGILEAYVLGATSEEETREVEALATTSDVIRQEIETIRKTVESYASKHAAPAPARLKSLVMEAVSYNEKVKNSETENLPPLLTEHSKAEDFALWLNREDLRPPDSFDNIHAVVIGRTPKVMTCIFWAKKMVPEEEHGHKYERLLIVEGSCDIMVEEKTYTLRPGDYFSIPLHRKHRVEITSSVPCKAIMQQISV